MAESTITYRCLECHWTYSHAGRHAVMAEKEWRAHSQRTGHFEVSVNDGHEPANPAKIRSANARPWREEVA